MLNIIISLDYELFGHGAGSVKKHIVKPTDKILIICKRYDVPLTIMFEACEYIKFEEYDEQLTQKLGYSPARMIKEQVSKAVNSGHDIQLHVHPQWADASYKGNKWILKQYPRTISDLTKDMIYETLKKGKEKLIETIGDINLNYRCNTARFTVSDSWNEAPFETFDALKELGIKAHSLSDNSPEGNKKGFWPLVKSNEIFEIPIYSIQLPRYKMFSILRVKTILYMYLITQSCWGDFKGKTTNKLLKSKHGFLAGLFKDKYTQKWDFCKQSAGEMLMFLEKAFKKYDYKNNEIPLVMLGHSNIFFNAKEFEKFLSIVKKKYLPTGNVRFSTFQEFVGKNLK